MTLLKLPLQAVLVDEIEVFRITQHVGAGPLGRRVVFFSLVEVSEIARLGLAYLVDLVVLGRKRPRYSSP